LKIGFLFLAVSGLSRTIGNDRWQAVTFDGKTDGQNLTPSLWRRLTVTSSSSLTANFKAIREHSCGFAGDSGILGR
jgi:hypothetical protein